MIFAMLNSGNLVVWGVRVRAGGPRGSLSLQMQTLAPDSRVQVPDPVLAAATVTSAGRSVRSAST